MQKNGILSLVTELREDLDTKLHGAKVADIHKEITSRIGSLSVPSKMPGYSWSISAKHCIVGSKLSEIPGTPCFTCYAKKNRYLFGNVQNAQETRLRGWLSDPDWVLLMAIRILLHKNEWFRWFDSGDLQSVQMLEDINKVAAYTAGYVEHWLPTQERAMVKAVPIFSRNLTVRISSTKIGRIQNTSFPGVVTSSVNKQRSGVPGECPSQLQNNKCGTCRACWDRTIPNVVYIEH